MSIMYSTPFFLILQLLLPLALVNLLSLFVIPALEAGILCPGGFLVLCPIEVSYDVNIQILLKALWCHIQDFSLYTGVQS